MESSRLARASTTRRWFVRAASSALTAGGIALPAAPPLAAQVAIKRAASGFNLFSVPQEREVGRQSALTIERRLPVVRGARVDRVLGGVTALLARSAPASPWKVLRASPWLRSATPTARVETVQGRRGYAISFGGRSPVTGELERLLVHVRAVNDDAVVYLACVTPERMGAAVERVCSRMSRSLRVVDPASVRP